MKILLVDDHPLVAQGLRAVLQHEPDMELAASALDGREALRLAGEIEPDLVVVDLRLPGESGLDLIRKLMRVVPGARCVVLTSTMHLSDVREALEIGADGYVLKDALPEELIAALRLVKSGRKHYDPKAMEVLIRSRGSEERLLAGLSLREIEVLRCLATGMSNRQIADHLHITENTAKKHISSILLKLNLEDRTKAALFALKHIPSGDYSPIAHRGGQVS
jgi:DNA-binding NarL/FixJ family response regulator